jgi:urease accessory protein
VSGRLAPADLKALARVRADAGARLAFAPSAGRTRIADLSEWGGMRVKFPDGGLGAEAVLINTGGGLLGGDRVRVDVTCAAGSDVTLTTQSAERVYRSAGPVTTVDVRIDVASGARVAWLPQETILFDQARVLRRLTADVARDACVTLIEMLVFGRAAHGEAVREGAVSDRWQIRRDGRLVFAEAVGLTGDIQAQLDRAAIGDGARAAATLLHVSPDAEARVEEVRAALVASEGRAAVSGWGGMLSARFLARDSSTVRRDLVHAVETVTRRPCPRVWSMRGPE